MQSVFSHVRAEREKLGYSRLQLARVLDTTAMEVRSWEEGLLSRPGAHGALLRWVPALELWVEGQRSTWDRVVGRAGTQHVLTSADPALVHDLGRRRDACRLTVDDLELLVYLGRFNSARLARTAKQCTTLGGQVTLDRALSEAAQPTLHRLQRLGVVSRAPDPTRVRVELYHSTEATRQRLGLELSYLSARDCLR